MSCGGAGQLTPAGGWGTYTCTKPGRSRRNTALLWGCARLGAMFWMSAPGSWRCWLPGKANSLSDGTGLGRSNKRDSELLLHALHPWVLVLVVMASCLAGKAHVCDQRVHGWGIGLCRVCNELLATRVCCPMRQQQRQRCPGGEVVVGLQCVGVHARSR